MTPRAFDRRTPLPASTRPAPVRHPLRPASRRDGPAARRDVVPVREAGREAGRETSASRSISHPAPRPALRPALSRIALVGNYPPRRCGIATFTADLRASFDTLPPAVRPTVDVFAMVDPDAAYDFDDAVVAAIDQNDPASYRRAALRLEGGGYDAVWVQHEFGIFGGPAGDMLLDLLDAVDLPVVTTLHTVLTDPDADQRRVMDALIARSHRVVTMAQKGVEILRETYDAPVDRIGRIPHGVPDRPLADTAPFKRALDLNEGGLEGEVMLTFGLLGPGKGLELMIDALPAIVRERPAARYVVLGATHPHLVAREGEAYREGLIERARANGVEHAVRFINRYVDFDTLLDHIAAADVYVTPYGNPAQITSGTLSYAVALGKPVVSTPFWHAAELLADGVGALVPFGDADALAGEIVSLLGDDERRETMRRRAYAAGRTMTWAQVAKGYRDVLEDAVLAEAALHVEATNVIDLRDAERRDAERRDAPGSNGDDAGRQRGSETMLSLQGVARLSDDCGILQHTVLSIPDRSQGYCLDDNARALVLCNEMGLIGHADPTAVRLARSYAAFVQHAWDDDAQRFRNFMGFDRRWLEGAEGGSPDSAGRGAFALAHTAERGLNADLRLWAAALAPRVLAAVGDVTSPRAAAFAILAATMLSRLNPADADVATVLETRAAHLAGQYDTERTDAWRWFEATLAYDNARLPEALIAAGLHLADEGYVARGLEALDWLSAAQRNARGQFRPVGHRAFGQHHALPPAAFDQQPLEAAATIDACAAAFDATGDAVWLERAVAAHDWFLGENDLGISLVQPEAGVCHDGLHPDRMNLNQGAESVLAFQLATCALVRLERAAAGAV